MVKKIRKGKIVVGSVPATKQTLLAIPIGATRRFSIYEIVLQSARTTASKLKKDNIAVFSISIVDIDKYDVHRIS